MHSIAILLTLFYVLLLVIYGVAWLLITESAYELSEQDTNTFTVLIPVRNEQEHIANCLLDLVNQQYDATKYEIIVINDYSTDDTVSIVNQVIQNHPSVSIRLLHMHDDPTQRKLKKAAITYGVKEAKGNYILLTDGDCRRGNSWLKAIDNSIQKKPTKFIYAPVMFSSTTLFEKIQSLEFVGLVAIGGAAIKLKNPNMCSAANIMFEKQAFNDVGGYEDNIHIASGDDEYLLHKFFKRYRNEIYFLKDNRATVTTTASNTLKQLSEQRRRWVSKSLKYENRYITAILVAAYLYNASIVYYLFADNAFGLQLLGAKFLIETIFLYVSLQFFRKQHLLLLMPLAELFHILYVLVIGIWANLGTYNWKGRSLN